MIVAMEIPTGWLIAMVVMVGILCFVFGMYLGNKDYEDEMARKKKLKDAISHLYNHTDEANKEKPEMTIEQKGNKLMEIVGDYLSGGGA